MAERSLVETIGALEPAALGRVIHHVGLEDSAALVALTSREQLEGLFDDDLWPEDVFAPDRFALWLELMLEAGDAWAADRLAGLPDDLVQMAFHRLVIVLRLEELVLTSNARDRAHAERIEAALDSCPSEELGDYVIVARQPDGWDAIFGALVALHDHEHDALVRLLDACAELALDEVDEAGGLYEMLTAAASAGEDALDGRDTRRRRRGFVAAEDARNFFTALSRATLDEVVATPGDGLFRAYRRQLDETPALDEAALLSMLRDAGVKVPDAPRRLPGPPTAFERAMAALAESDPEGFEEANEALAFLGNLALAARSELGAAEAARDVVVKIERGMQHLAVDRFDDRGLVQLFRVGWKLS